MAYASANHKEWQPQKRAKCICYLFGYVKVIRFAQLEKYSSQQFIVYMLQLII